VGDLKFSTATEVIKETRDPIADYKNKSVPNLVIPEKHDGDPNNILQTLQKLVDSDDNIIAEDKEPNNIYKFTKAKQEPLYNLV
jgi:hypothetical protein